MSGVGGHPLIVKTVRGLEHCLELGDYRPANPPALCVAVSGGRDSTSLATLLARYAREHWPRQRIVHVNHHLTANKGEMERASRDTASALGLEFELLEIFPRRQARESLEAVARDARYAALEQCLKENEVLITAHHQDDQAETVVLQLLRGAGCDGLAAMPPVRRFATSYHLRPWLQVTNAEIDEFASIEGVCWVDDASNHDLNFDRNYLRRQVMPKIAQRWPGYRTSITRSAALQEEYADYFDKNIAARLPELEIERGVLSIERLVSLSPLEVSLIVRAWFKRHSVPPPSAKLLEELQRQMSSPSRSGSFVVAWKGYAVRHYQNRLYLTQINHNDFPQAEVSWDLTSSLGLESGTLCAKTTVGKGISRGKLTQLPLNVTSRSLASEVELPYQGGHKNLKKVFQEAKVPPWLRETHPIIRSGGQRRMYSRRL